MTNSRTTGRPVRWLLLLACGVAVVSASVAAAVLTDATVRDYSAYAERARQAFVKRLTEPVGAAPADRSALRANQVIARAAEGDGVQKVEGGLIHHWRAMVFISGVTLDQVLSVSRAYADYPKVFHPVLSATVLADQGDVLRVRFRMKESAGGLTATFDVTSTIRYERLDPSRAYDVSTSDEILEVKDAGEPDERHLPAGRDSGYLWRGAALTRFVAADGGVYMEMETIGLSRPFPSMLGWLIEPIARRVGRRSVEASVQEFRTAVRMRFPAIAAAAE